MVRTLVIGTLLSLLPAVASAQTWQEWSKKNPTYPSLEKPATVTVPAPRGTNLPVLPSLPDGLPPQASTKSPEFKQAFMQGCAQNGDIYRPLCSCVLKRTQSLYTIKEVFMIFGQAKQSGTLPQTYIAKAVMPCTVLLPRR